MSALLRILLTHPSRPTLLPALAPFAAAALALPAAAQVYHASANNAGQPGTSKLGSAPVYADWVGTNPQTYQYGRATAGTGIFGCKAISEHYTTGSFQSDTDTATYFEFDDAVFASPGSSAIPVSIHLTLEGNYVVNTGAQVQIRILVQGVTKGSATATNSGVTQTTGVLSGYDMTTPQSFQVPFNAQVNTPFTVKVGLEVNADTNYIDHKTHGEFRLRFGAAAPGPNGLYPVFSLPPGVSVDSTQARIQQNLWQPPKDLYLMPGQPTLSAGEKVVFTSWNGPAAQPVGVFLTSIDGAPAPIFLGGSALSADGIWGFGPISYSPGLSGLTFGLRSFALDAQGQLIISDEQFLAVL